MLRIEELKPELFFFVVRGQEDLMVLAETFYEAEKGIRGRTHRREDSGGAGGVKSECRLQNAECKTAGPRGRRTTEEERQKGGGVKSKGKTAVRSERRTIEQGKRTGGGAKSRIRRNPAKSLRKGRPKP